MGDLWRACRHLPPRGTEGLAGPTRTGDAEHSLFASAQKQSRNADGLCYFHLN